jgi:hypothetical protein
MSKECRRKTQSSLPWTREMPLPIYAAFAHINKADQLFLAFCIPPSPIDDSGEALFFPPAHPEEGAVGGHYKRLPTPSVLFFSLPGQPSKSPIIPCSCRYLVIVKC